MPSKIIRMIKTARVVGILRAVMKLMVGPIRKDSSHAMISGRMTDWAVFSTAPTATSTRIPRKINVILPLSNSIVNFFLFNRRIISANFIACLHTGSTAKWVTNAITHHKGAESAEKKIKLCELCASAVNNFNPYSPASHTDPDVSVSVMNCPPGVMSGPFSS